MMQVLSTSGFADYELLDSGHGRKLERYGAVIVDRPEPQAMWRPRQGPDAWQKAHARFVGQDEDAGAWTTAPSCPKDWNLRVADATVECRLTSFRHLGIFPEQFPHWEFMVERLRGHQGARPKLLNLFGYTGVASLLAAAAGAEVVHIDASKTAVAWARHNQALSNLGDRPIRWIVEDARKFVQREQRRGNVYNGILVDPPKFGRGPNGETWELFEHLPEMIGACANLLAPEQAFLVVTAYAIRMSAVSLDTLVREHLAARGGIFSSGELAITERGEGRPLVTSLFTRWHG
ncbi:MAG: class I SAM-dependent methyltransferase [Rhodospirillaceae bacterium]|nr:class I SAM-dependent methyltransferase [Rhodospirillaceae bacterium]